MSDRLTEIAARAAAAYEPLSPENRAAIAELIGDIQPAGPDFLLRLGHTVKDCRTHDHGQKVGPEDLFCGNLQGWMGERMALVMRRLLDAEAELAKCVGKEPTRDEEAQYVTGCLDAVYDACEAALREGRALTVEEIEQSADGNRSTRRPSRAEVLREAADAVRSHPEAQDEHMGGMDRAADLLRRMADAAGKETPAAGGDSTRAAAPDFFQPGRTYSGSHGWKFRVDSITIHPEDGARTALGWRFFNDSWEPYAYEEDDWEIIQAAGHTDIALGGVATVADTDMTREVERLRVERDELAAAAKRVAESLQHFMDDSSDPGTEALAAQYELSTMLTRLSIGEPLVSETDYLSRFSVLPSEVHAFLARRLAEDVHLRYQQAIGSHAVEQAAKHLRMAAACQQAAGEITSPREYRAAADDIDPMKRGSGGPYPAELIRFGTQGGGAR
ncbi:hypothetical protein [Streptomyces kronopolitis]|uniref:hypothetical protein n=1 Tax=Streptomyces kronopolitis TaxID=1612435 RepID=UPI003D990A04